MVWIVVICLHCMITGSLQTGKSIHYIYQSLQTGRSICYIYLSLQTGKSICYIYLSLQTGKSIRYIYLSLQTGKSIRYIYLSPTYGLHMIKKDSLMLRIYSHIYFSILNNFGQVRPPISITITLCAK